MEDLHPTRQPDPEGAPLERRLAAAIVRMRHDEPALTSHLRRLPRVDWMRARIVLIRHLGSARAAALCNGAFGPGMGRFPLVQVDAVGEVAPSAQVLFEFAVARGLRDVIAGLLRLERASDPGLIAELVTGVDRHVALAAISVMGSTPWPATGRDLLAMVDERTGGGLGQVAAALHRGCPSGKHA